MTRCRYEHPVDPVHQPWKRTLIGVMTWVVHKVRKEARTTFLLYDPFDLIPELLHN